MTNASDQEYGGSFYRL